MEYKSAAPRIIAPKSPNLFQIALEIQKKGPLQFFTDQWRIQGDVPHLRMGLHNLFFIIHPDHVGHVLLTNRKNYDKLKTWDVTRRLLLGSGLIGATGAHWKRQRKLMSAFFTPKSVELYFTLMLNAASDVTTRWETASKSGQALDIMEEMTRITAWIILRSMFGMDLSEERLRTIERDVETMIRFVYRREMLPVKAPLWAPLPSHVQYRKATSRVHLLMREVIERRRSMPESSWPNDLLSKLMSARDEESGETMADVFVRDECIGIFIAGHETSARTMAFMWYSLHENPEVAAHLRRELDAVIPENQQPTLEDLKQLPYLTRVIKEVLRLYPPAPAFPRDPVTEETLNGVRLEAGAFVMVAPYFTHRHPDFWTNPEHFDPDRFLPEREREFHPYAYCPFGGGNRICIGNSFAMLEMSVLTAVLARRFDAHLIAGHKPEIEMGGTLMIRNGLPMRIVQRV